MRGYLRRAYRTLLPLLYGRSNFKLFMQASLYDVDGRVRELAALADYFSGFLRPIPIRAPFGRNVLVVAPHQDDEAIGCGGAMALQAASGRPPRLVMLCDGADECDELGMTRDALCALRNAESRRAAALLGMEEPRFLNYSNLAGHTGEAAEDLRGLLSDGHVDAVFAPWLLDGHLEHRVAAGILASALKGIGRNIRVLSYEVWGLVIPNVILPIDDAMDRKLEMLSCFAYANRAKDYVNGTQGLNMYRSRLLGSGICRYAECFFEAPSREYVEMVERASARDAAPPPKP